MTETPAHRRFRHIDVPGCLSCGWTQPHRIIHREAEVLYRCDGCGRPLVRFYRVPSLERHPARTDSGLIGNGNTVSSRRIVAWVGYARNPETVSLHPAEVEKRAAFLLATELTAASIYDGTYIPDMSVVLPTDEYLSLARNLLEVSAAIGTVFLRRARYELRRGEMYAQPTLRNRGFWFRDMAVNGTIVGTVNCQTGLYIGGKRDKLWGEWDPPTLIEAVRHSLYVVRESRYKSFLVHPLDVRHVTN